MNEFNFARQGWQCPICKRVYSPITPWCYFCGNEQTITTTGVTITTGTPPTQDVVIKAGSEPVDKGVSVNCSNCKVSDTCESICIGQEICPLFVPKEDE